MAYRKTDHVRGQFEDRRARILMAARDLVLELGSLDTHVTDVARRAALATGTVYRYFPSKAQLLSEVVRMASQHELEIIAAIASDDAAPAARLEAAVTTFLDRALKGRRLARLLVAEVADGGIFEARRHYRRALAAQLHRILADGVAMRDFAAQDSATTAAALVGGLNEALIVALAGDIDEGQAAELVREVMLFCRRAAGAS